MTLTNLPKNKKAILLKRPENEITDDLFKIIDEECIDREDGIWCISDSILGSCIHGQYHETSCVDMVLAMYAASQN